MNYRQMFQPAYAGKRVFVTGHTGFKGSWLISWLHRLGAEVRGYALVPQANELFQLIDGSELCDSVIADIRDQDTLTKAITQFAPDYIFHLAAQSLVRVSYESPAETFDINVRGTIHLLESLKSLSKSCNVIIVTTDKVYRNIETHHAYREDDPLGGYDPYSSSKAAAEIAVSSYRDSFFNLANYSDHRKKVATARAGNVIGGGDRAKDRIIPDIVRAMEENKPVLVRNPSSIRPWQHVLEPLSGYLLLGAKMNENNFPGSAWNFGPEENDVLTVEELVKLALKSWGNGKYEPGKSDNQPHEAGILKLDINKAKKELNWRPRMNSEKAIRMTMDWYKGADGHFREYTFRQIETFESGEL